MKKIMTGIVAVALAVTVGLGASIASADKGKNTDSVVPSVVGPHLRAKKLCAMQTKVATKVAKVKAELNGKVTALTAQRDAAQNAGKTKKVEKLNAKLAVINGIISTIDSRYAAYQTWTAANCTAPAPPTSGPSTSTPSTSTPSTSTPSTSTPSTSTPTSSSVSA
jgi:hypothetical protein